jgi:hypothetical protein
VPWSNSMTIQIWPWPSSTLQNFRSQNGQFDHDQKMWNEFCSLQTCANVLLDSKQHLSVSKFHFVT